MSTFSYIWPAAASARGCVCRPKLSIFLHLAGVSASSSRGPDQLFGPARRQGSVPRCRREAGPSPNAPLSARRRARRLSASRGVLAGRSHACRNVASVVNFGLISIRACENNPILHTKATFLHGSSPERRSAPCSARRGPGAVAVSLPSTPPRSPARDDHEIPEMITLKV